jgi:radical SAM protein with 4Fe4S-binding SPASM domain
MNDDLSPAGLILESAFEKCIPVNALIELTHRCNLNCGHCYVSESRSDELSLAELVDVFDQLAEAGCLFLTFSGGEVMMRPDWLDVLGEARERGFAIRVFTNGTMLEPVQARALADLGVIDVSLSLYGSTAATHDAVTGVPGSFAHTMRAIELLTGLGIQTTAKYLLMNHNYVEFSEARAVAESKGASFRFSYNIAPQTDGGTRPLDWRLNSDNLAAVLGDGFLYEGTARVPRPEQAGPATELAGEPMCGAGRDNLALSPYGDIKPCTMLPLAAGNLREQRFADLWKDSPALNRLRQTYMGDVKKCRDCRSVGFCGRCPGFALLEDGDILGPSTFACQVEAIGESVAAGVSESNGGTR